MWRSSTWKVWLGAALGLALLCGGCHLIFPFDHGPGSDVAVDAVGDGVARDAAPDHPLSDGRTDGALDARLDLPVQFDLGRDLGFTCSCAKVDTNGDGKVDQVDFDLFVSCFGNLAAGACKVCDFNGDGVVGALDFICLGKLFGKTCT